MTDIYREIHNNSNSNSNSKSEIEKEWESLQSILEY